MQRTTAFVVGLVCWLCADLSAQDPNVTLQLGTAEVFQAQRAEIPLTMTSDAPVQGLAAVFAWERGPIEGLDLVPGAALADADTVVRRVGPNYMVLGVVYDTDASGPDAIPPGDDLDLAAVSLLCKTAPDDGSFTTPIDFVDGQYAAAEGGVALDNIVVVDGLSIGSGDGLELVGGEIQCVGTTDVTLIIGDGSNVRGDVCGTVEVTMDNPSTNVEGYELAIAHPEALSLQNISIEGTAAEEFGAEFAIFDILAGGGTLGVIMDLVEPFEANHVPAGENHTIARLTYCCEDLALGAGPPVVHDLTFVDDVLGDPPKRNVVVVNGMSVEPAVVDGTFTCQPISEICDDDVDNDGDGDIDCDDEDCSEAGICAPSAHEFAVGARELDADGLPEVVVGQLGQAVEVSFFYKSPEDGEPGGPQTDQIQGVSMVLCYPCGLTCDEDSFDIEGTIVEAIGADFHSLQCDNDPEDGDGCELILGLLVDALPPFNGETLPPTDVFWRLGSATFTVDDDEELCRECLPLVFCDGANGRGSVPIRNLVSTENRSFRPRVVGNEVCIFTDELFHRGDCDFSSRVNVNDAASVVFTLFGRGVQEFTPPCEDACDCNDDGRIDVADAACVVLFLFAQGDRPPAPGPGVVNFFDREPPGLDPTDDNLTCLAGRSCQ